MVKIQKNIIISKPAQTIWAILDNPVQSSGLNPKMKLLYCYESRLGGYDRVFHYCIGGKTFEIGAQITDYASPRYMAYTTCGAFQSAWHWWLEGDGRQTHVSLTVDYTLPRSLADGDSAALEQENAQVMETQLANLKQLAEKST